jgi:membrane carboxypeptidase/penicillin-binding protein
VRQTVKLTLGASILLVGATTVYASVVVYRARRDTPALMAATLRSSEMVLDPEDLTPRQLEILLRVQDPRFFEHNGLDFRTRGAGWTTITQALVKIHYFDSFEPGAAKLRQSLIARFALDPLVSKHDQLRMFLNEAYLGTVDEIDVVGFEQGARFYFDKAFFELSEDEYIALVAMLIAPNSCNVRLQPKLNAERVTRIQRLLAGECAPNTWSDVWFKGCMY